MKMLDFIYSMIFLNVGIQTALSLNHHDVNICQLAFISTMILLGSYFYFKLLGIKL